MEHFGGLSKTRSVAFTKRDNPLPWVEMPTVGLKKAKKKKQKLLVCITSVHLEYSNHSLTKHRIITLSRRCVAFTLLIRLEKEKWMLPALYVQDGLGQTGSGGELIVAS